MSGRCWVPVSRAPVCHPVAEQIGESDEEWGGWEIQFNLINNKDWFGGHGSLWELKGLFNVLQEELDPHSSESAGPGQPSSSVPVWTLPTWAVPHVGRVHIGRAEEKASAWGSGSQEHRRKKRGINASGRQQVFIHPTPPLMWKPHLNPLRVFTETWVCDDILATLPCCLGCSAACFLFSCVNNSNKSGNSGRMELYALWTGRGGYFQQNFLGPCPLLSIPFTPSTLLYREYIFLTPRIKHPFFLHFLRWSRTWHSQYLDLGHGYTGNVCMWKFIELYT